MRKFWKKSFSFIMACMILTTQVQAKDLDSILKEVDQNVKSVQQTVSDVNDSTKKVKEEVGKQVDAVMGGSLRNGGKGTMATSALPAPAAPTGTVAKGVDISKWNWPPNRAKNIDFAKLSKSVDFVIIRCGYGGDKTSQDDAFFKQSVEACEKYNIPYGVYLYSYAKTESAALGEAQHTLRNIKEAGAKPTLPVFLDMEDAEQGAIGSSKLATVAKTYCNVIEKAGYKTGIYASYSWWNSKLTNSYFNTTVKWIARYNKTLGYSKPYDIWQCSANVAVDGISGIVDYNYMVTNLIKKNNTIATTAKPTTTATTAKPTTEATTAKPTTTETTTEVGPKPVDEFTVKSYTGTYDGKAHSITVLHYKKIEYSTDNKTWSSKNPTRTKIGTTTVYYKATDVRGNSQNGKAKIKITARNMANSVVASIKNYTVTGKQIKPAVTVFYGDVTLKKGTDYTLSYGSNKKIGTGTVTITGKNTYTGKKKVSFAILPGKVKGIKVTQGKILRSATLNWKAIPNVSAYQVAYARKGQSNWSYATVNKNEKTFFGLLVKTYDVKIRACTDVAGVRQYGAFSQKLTMTVK